MLSLAPIKSYVNENTWQYAERLQVMQGNNQRLYVQLVNEDGKPQFVPTTTAMKVLFGRARSPSGAVQSIEVTLVRANILDSSVYYFDLTATQADAVISGGAKLSVTPQAGTASVYPVDNLIEKRLSAPGC